MVDVPEVVARVVLLVPALVILHAVSLDAMAAGVRPVEPPLPSVTVAVIRLMITRSSAGEVEDSEFSSN